MANNVFPANPGPYRLSGPFQAYTDSALSKRAQIFDVNGGKVPGNVVTIDSLGQVQTFQAAATVVYIASDTGAALPLYSSHVLTAPTVTGSKGANAALTSLMAALAQQGIVVDSTS